MAVQLLRGNEAVALLGDDAFSRAWEELYARCPWATVFQSPAFIRIWYRHYEADFELIFLMARDAAGALSGFFPLARGRKGTSLTGAGDHHSEYQTWLSSAENADDFVSECIVRLRREFPRGTLRLGYVPAASPLEWTRQPSIAQHVFSRPARRGYVETGHPSVAQTLDKKRTRYHLNRIARTGAIEFARVTTTAGFDEIIGQAIAICDFRQAAANDISPFRSDARKLPFHRELFEHGGLLHITALKAGDKLVSVEINIINRDEVLLSVLGHAPEVARDSPGYLHMLLLCRLLAEEGVRWFDLSPDGHYKDRIAQEHDTASVVIVDFSSVRALGIRAARRALAWGRSVRPAALSRARLMERAMAVLKPVQGQEGESVRKGGIVRLLRHVHHEQEWQIFVLTRSSAPGRAPAAGWPDAGNLEHLLSYDFLGEKPQSRQEFFRQCTERMARGHVPMTRVSGNRLDQIAWLAPDAGALPISGFPSVTLPRDAALLYDIQGTGGPGDHQWGVQVMQAAAAHLAPGTTQLYVMIPNDAPELARACTELGFVRAFRYGIRHRLFHPTQWTDAPPEMVTAEAPEPKPAMVESAS